MEHLYRLNGVDPGRVITMAGSTPEEMALETGGGDDCFDPEAPQLRLRNSQDKRSLACADAYRLGKIFRMTRMTFI
jgi:hypothetical protein